jgi:hypothetical protein
LKLTNTDFFRQEALNFQEQGYYCKYPSDSPKGKAYWNEQAYRSIHGYTRENDGIWITGYHYFYLNFCPIIIAEQSVTTDIKDNKEGISFKGDRIQGFPSFWDGDYKYFHYLDQCENNINTLNHAVVLKARRKGFSFKGGSMLCRNYFLIPRSKSYAFAYEKEFLTEDGLLTKAWDIMDFIDSHTAWAKRRGKYNQEFHRRASYVTESVDGVWIEKGFKSEIIGVSFRDNWNKSRGKAGKLALYEEAGFFKNLWKSWNVGLPSMKQGNMITGLSIAFGTGGSEGADFMSLEDMFNYPGKYSVNPFPYDWEGTGRLKNHAFFFPDYWNRDGCMDKDGNSDIEKAIKEVEAEVEFKIKEGGNSEDVTRHVAEHPLKPAHALMKIGLSNFPVDDLRKQLEELEDNPKEYKEKEYWGNLIETGEGLKWKDDRSLTPINEFPLKDLRTKKGAYCIWERPIISEVEGKIADGIYIAGLDSYDDDQAPDSPSLGSLWIMNLLTDRIVAEYTGRPETAEDYYVNVIKLLQYYNALCCYERRNKGIYQYLKSNSYLSLLKHLALEPKILKDQNISKANTIGNNAYGFNPSVATNQYGREEFKKWMLTQAYGREDGVKNISTIRSIPLIKEAMYWNGVDNFDRISGMGALMILRADRKRFIESMRANQGKPKEKEDNFWNKHYPSNKRIMLLVANK